jgi:uncharacterized repeat protein (TIGR01451 family)
MGAPTTITRVFLSAFAALILGWHLPAHGAVDIEVTKTASVASIVELANVQFTITAGNLGTDLATGLVIYDQLPPQLSLLGAVPSAGTFSAINRRWTLPTLAGGATETLLLTANAPRGSAGTVTNTAQVLFLDQSDSNSGNDLDSADVEIFAPDIDIEVTKTANVASVFELENIEFTITARNLGTDLATGVAIFDLLPTQLLLQGAVPSAGIFSTINRRWTLPTLSGGATETLVLTASATLGSGGTIATNSAQLLFLDQSDSNPGNDLDSAQVSISAQAIPTLSGATTILLAVLLAGLGATSVRYLRQRDDARV